jgi:hypothetical protein
MLHMQLTGCCNINTHSCTTDIPGGLTPLMREPATGRELKHFCPHNLFPADQSHLLLGIPSARSLELSQIKFSVHVCASSVKVRPLASLPSQYNEKPQNLLLT